jgi:hypothetical protein
LASEVAPLLQYLAQAKYLAAIVFQCFVPVWEAEACYYPKALNLKRKIFTVLMIQIHVPVDEKLPNKIQEIPWQSFRNLFNQMSLSHTIA